MSATPTARRRTMFRVALIMGFLMFSVAAVEVAPLAVALLQDIGWLASTEEAAQEGAALASPNDGAAGHASISIEIDDAAMARLTQFIADEVTPGDGLRMDIVPGQLDTPNSAALEAAARAMSPDVLGALDPTFGSYGARAARAAGFAPDDPSIWALDLRAGFANPGSGGSASADGTTLTDAASGSLLEESLAGTLGGPSVVLDLRPTMSGDSLPADDFPASPLASAAGNPGAAAEAVPEPTTLLLLGSGLVALAIYGKRKARI